jgi:hypothetical protein
MQRDMPRTQLILKHVMPNKLVMNTYVLIQDIILSTQLVGYNNDILANKHLENLPIPATGGTHIIAICRNRYYISIRAGCETKRGNIVILFLREFFCCLHFLDFQNRKCSVCLPSHFPYPYNGHQYD